MAGDGGRRRQVVTVAAVAAVATLVAVPLAVWGVRSPGRPGDGAVRSGSASSVAPVSGTGSSAHGSGTTGSGTTRSGPGAPRTPSSGGGAAAGGAAAGGTSGVASASALVPVAPTPTVPVGATSAGPLPPATAVHIEVVLQPRDPTGLTQFVQSVSDPSSPDYRHYLPKGAFDTRFGPAPATVAAVRATLVSAGLTVTPVTTGTLLMGAHGTAAQVAAALHTDLEQFRLADGRTAFADVTAPELRRDVATDVAGVAGLSDLVEETPLLQHASGSTSTSPGASPAPDLGTDAAVTACHTAKIVDAYTWTGLAATYGFTTAYTHGDEGTGETIGLFELAQYPPTDLATFESCYQITPASVTTVPTVTGGAGPATTGQDEAILDIEDVLGLAPKAKVLVYSAKNTKKTADMHALAEYAHMVTTDQAQVISTSWGDCETGLTPGIEAAENLWFERAGAQGQTVFAADGDTGSEGCLATRTTGLRVEDPSSQPYVTAVGGTDLVADAPTSPSEQAWRLGGGGPSDRWAKPSWQTTGRPAATVPVPTAGVCQVAPASPVTTTGCRQVPDVAASAATTGGHGAVLYCRGATRGTSGTSCTTGDGWIPVGGTSVAAPLWAALAAVTAEGCGTPLGFLDPLLYQLGNDGSGAFHDVTTGTNDIDGGHPGDFHAAAGYDDATGWGSPDGANFFTAACQAPLGTASTGSASVTLSTSIARAPGVTYTLGFTTSATGLAAGDPVDLTGPAGTAFPAGPSNYTMVAPVGVTVSSATPLTTHTSTSDDAVALTFGSALPPMTTVQLTIGPVTNGRSEGLFGVDVAGTEDPALFTLTAGPPSPTFSTVVPTPPTVGIGHTATVAVTDLDGYGNPEMGHAVTLTASPPTGVTISPTPAGTSASGVATFTVTGDAVETVTLTASDGGTVLGQAALRFVKTGYWEVASDGGIFSFGVADFDGSMGGQPLNAPVVGMAATPTGGGYWEVASDGGIFSFGNAQFSGSMGGHSLDAPIVGMATDPATGGYWEVASDGGIFAFTAPFDGSMGGQPLNAPVVGMAATPTGGGYWEVASDGGIFSFGNAQFSGSMGGHALDAPIVGMATDPATGGYWEVASDGGIFAFRAPFDGSMGGQPLNAPVVGIATTVTDRGYWEVASDGGIFSWGDATFDGSMGGRPLNRPINGMAAT